MLPTLSKDIFCSKLSAYGFDEVSVSWFESYLSGRSQIVIVGASMSEECQLTVGSTQKAGRNFSGLKVQFPTSKFGSKGKCTPILSALEAFLTTTQELQSWQF